MNIKSAKEVLKYMLKTKITPLFIGEHGVGKTQMVSQYCQEHNLELKMLRLGQMSDAGDLTGLPQIISEDIKDGEYTATELFTKFILPRVFPRVSGNGGILFLDEINRAHPDLIQPIFQLIENGGFGEYTLPDNWSVVAAANPPTDDYQVTDFRDKAFQDRFVHIELNPPRSEFLEYARNKKFDSRIVHFLTEHDKHIRNDGAAFSISDFVEPTQRSWEKVHMLLNNELPKQYHAEVFSGLVGLEATNHFLKFMEDFEVVIKGQDILDNFNKIKDKVDVTRIDSLHATLEDIMAILTDKEYKPTKKHVNNYVNYLIMLPRDLVAAQFKALSAHTDLILNSVFEKEFLNNKELMEYLKISLPKEA